MSDHDARGFAELARELMSEPAEEVTFDKVVKRAVDVVPGCDLAGVTLRTGRNRLETVAHTDEVVLECDELQYSLDEGPCVDAVHDAQFYVAGDLEHDERWPRWGPEAARRGVGSVLALQLSDGSRSLGALNLYGRKHAFGDDDVDLALTYGVHATNALRSARLVTNLQTALRTRHEIGMAQGILMREYGLDEDGSFEVLRRYSNNLNTPLREVARAVVDGRRLPPGQPPA